MRGIRKPLASEFGVPEYPPVHSRSSDAQSSWFPGSVPFLAFFSFPRSSPLVVAPRIHPNLWRARPLQPRVPPPLLVPNA